MKLCADPRHRAEPEALAEALRPRAAEGVPAGAPRPHDRRPLLPARRRRAAADHPAPARPDRAGASRENHNAAFTYDDALVEHIAGRCTEVESGARKVDHILTSTLLPRVSREFLARLGDERPVDRVALGVADGDLTYDFAGA